MDIRHEETALDLPGSTPHGPWPEDSLARVPYWVYQDEANYKREMQRLFEAATWNFVCLEADIPDKGDYRTNHVGALPVIVVRDADGSINCFENRCAHRGALIAFDDGGNVQNNFKCIYHAWSYDLAGNLRGIAFERGINGLGGMPKDFCREDFSPRKLQDDDAVRPGVRHPLARHAADRGVYRQRGAGPPEARAQPADPRHGPLRAAAAQQLEALCRERQGHLSREPVCIPSWRPSASRA